MGGSPEIEVKRAWEKVGEELERTEVRIAIRILVQLKNIMDDYEVTRLKELSESFRDFMELLLGAMVDYNVEIDLGRREIRTEHGYAYRIPKRIQPRFYRKLANELLSLPKTHQVY